MSLAAFTAGTILAVSLTIGGTAALLRADEVYRLENLRTEGHGFAAPRGVYSNMGE